MKRKTISLRRRQLMIAGLASAAAPAFAAAVLPGHGSVDRSALPTGDELLLSGRVVGPDGLPLPHATIELAHGDVRTMTDADGRFMVTTTAPRAGRLDYRIVHGERRAWVRHSTLAGGSLQRDEAGVWRTTVGLTVA